ncbi:hypothetical protein SRB17_35160 [Streptomyces sp. RB17]|nr:hypothetical protein [Streptomyces sp. RB17]
MVEPAVDGPLQLAVQLPVRLPVVPLGLTRYTLCLTCVTLPCFGRFLRVAPVPSPPGTPRTQVISPLAQSATAMHISTRLLF